MSNTSPWTVALITGTRADYGLLRSIMRAINASPDLHLQTVVTGAHLLPDVNTRAEVAAEFSIAADVPMQQPGAIGRIADVIALGRGITGMAETFTRLKPDVVLVLGDRIEAFAAASAASVAGLLLAHVHGGDRAEGVADEAMRHAITKLAHVHFPATAQSAARIARMGEREDSIHLVGSPAIDDLASFAPFADARLSALDLDPARPFAVVLHHPSGLSDAIEYATMTAIIAAIDGSAFRSNVTYLAPNHDPGRAAVLRALGGRPWTAHLPRAEFIGLLRRAAVLVGNSSAGLIEAAALGLPAINIGPRQAGRERAGNVIDVADATSESIAAAIRDAARRPRSTVHPYGDGRAGERIAEILAVLRRNPPTIRKHNAY